MNPQENVSDHQTVVARPTCVKYSTPDLHAEARRITGAERVAIASHSARDFQTIILLSAGDYHAHGTSIEQVLERLDTAVNNPPPPPPAPPARPAESQDGTLTGLRDELQRWAPGARFRVYDAKDASWFGEQFRTPVFVVDIFDWLVYPFDETFDVDRIGAEVHAEHAEYAMWEMEWANDGGEGDVLILGRSQDLQGYAIDPDLLDLLSKAMTPDMVLEFRPDRPMVLRGEHEALANFFGEHTTLRDGDDTTHFSALSDECARWKRELAGEVMA